MKTINNMDSDLDISILHNIVQNEAYRIKKALASIYIGLKGYSPDESTIAIAEKNLINGLEFFYDNFIKQLETKLYILDKFFKESDYIDEIENAADSIQIFISTYMNRNSLKLEPNIFNNIIQKHTVTVNGDKKSLLDL